MDEIEPDSHSPYGKLVGTRILDRDPDRGAIEVEFQTRHEFTNRIGTIAGGMIASLLDAVTGLAANEGLPDDKVAVHASMTVHYHAKMLPGRIVGRGERVEIVDRDITSRGELFDETGKRLASAEARLRIIWAPGSRPPT